MTIEINEMLAMEEQIREAIDKITSDKDIPITFRSNLSIALQGMFMFMCMMNKQSCVDIVALRHWVKHMINESEKEK